MRFVRQHAKTAAKIIVVLAIVFAVRYAFMNGIIDRTDLQRMLDRAGLLAVPGFILMMAAAIMVFVPAWIFIGSASIAFGARWGAVYSMLGALVGTSAAFLLGRYLASDFAERQRQRRLRHINEWLDANGIVLTLCARLVFYCHSAFNYAASVTSVTFRDYVIGTFVGLLPGIILFSSVFDVLVRADSLVDLLTHPALILLWSLRIGGGMLLSLLVKRSSERKRAERGYLLGIHKQ